MNQTQRRKGEALGLTQHLARVVTDAAGEGAAEKTLGLPYTPGTDRPGAGWMTQGEWLRKRKGKEGAPPNPVEEAVSWLGGVWFPFMFLDARHVGAATSEQTETRPRSPDSFPSFTDSEALPCAGSSGAPPSAHFCPWETRQRVAVRHHFCGPGQGPALSRSGEGRLAWALLGVHSLSPLN